MENSEEYNSTLEELEAARNQLSNYQSLLRDLPELYERKFEERLRPIRDRNLALSQEGAGLREQLDRALPAAHDPQRSRLPAATTPAIPEQRNATTKTPAPTSHPPRRWLPIGLAGAASLALVAGLGPIAKVISPFNHRSSPSTAGSFAPAVLPGASQNQAHAPLAPARPMDDRRSRAKTSPIQSPDATTPAQNNGQRTAPDSPAAPGELILTASAPTWLEVHDSDDHPLMAETFTGQRRLKLGNGLRLLAGRPDQITIQVHGTPPRRLGTIDAVGWQTIQPRAVAAPQAKSAPPARPGPAATPTLDLETREPSWIEVRQIDGATIYGGLLSGRRTFPLGRGLEVRSGRADVVSVAIDQTPAKRLGSIDDLGWHRFTPPPTPGATAASTKAGLSFSPQFPAATTSGSNAKPTIPLFDSLGTGLKSLFSPQRSAKPHSARTENRAAGQSATNIGSEDPAADELILRASSPTWLEVRDANNRPVLAETFQGQRRLPLGKGVRLLAGRPDLLTVQQHGQPPQPLGSINDLRWFKFTPAAQMRSAT